MMNSDDAPKDEFASPVADDLPGFERAFGFLAFTCNRHIIDHMLRFSRSFGLDYETMVIWGVLAHQNVAHLIPLMMRGEGYSDTLGHTDDDETRLRPVRVRDLVQITRIPKETVRRKLDLLDRDGWIRQAEQGWVICHERSQSDLLEFTRESVKRLLGASSHIQRILESVQESPQGGTQENRADGPK